MADRATLKLRHAGPEVAVAQAAIGATVVAADGRWVIYRRFPKGYRRGGGGNRLPRFHHETIQAATSEAIRLALENPDAVFVILQEQFEVQAA